MDELIYLSTICFKGNIIKIYTNGKNRRYFTKVYQGEEISLNLNEFLILNDIYNKQREDFLYQKNAAKYVRFKNKLINVSALLACIASLMYNNYLSNITTYDVNSIKVIKTMGDLEFIDLDTFKQYTGNREISFDDIIEQINRNTNIKQEVKELLYEIINDLEKNGEFIDLNILYENLKNLKIIFRHYLSGKEGSFTPKTKKILIQIPRKKNSNEVDVEYMKSILKHEIIHASTIFEGEVGDVSTGHKKVVVDLRRYIVNDGLISLHTQQGIFCVEGFPGLYNTENEIESYSDDVKILRFLINIIPGFDVKELASKGIIYIYNELIEIGMSDQEAERILEYMDICHYNFFISEIIQKDDELNYIYENLLTKTLESLPINCTEYDIYGKFFESVDAISNLYLGGASLVDSKYEKIINNMLDICNKEIKKRNLHSDFELKNTFNVKFLEKNDKILKNNSKLRICNTQMDSIADKIVNSFKGDNIKRIYIDAFKSLKKCKEELKLTDQEFYEIAKQVMENIGQKKYKSNFGINNVHLNKKGKIVFTINLETVENIFDKAKEMKEKTQEEKTI